MTKAKFDNYTVCLLGWYFGYMPKEIRATENEWTQEDIDKAQAYCEKTHTDPEAYWNGR